MTEFNIKSKTAGKCRVYPDSPNGLQPSVTSICGALMKYGLIQWAANCAVDYLLNIHPEKLYLAQGDSYIPNRAWEEARLAHEQIKDDAADFGTWAHTLCEKWMNKDKPGWIEAAGQCQKELDEQSYHKCMALVESFKLWANKNTIEPVHTEIVLHGDGYSGRCDLIAYRTDPKTKERVLGLYDIKTGKGSYYPEWGLQLAAYAEAYDDMKYEEWIKDPYDTPTSNFSELDIDEIGIIKLNKDTLKCNFSEDRGPKFTEHRGRLTAAWKHLVNFYWLYNELEQQFEGIENERTKT